MHASFDPLEFPACWMTPDRFHEESAWVEHIPFAFAIVEMLQPGRVVELGVHRGDSYLAFCQAVKSLSLTAKCFGVDTWEGDPHSGTYGPEVLQSLQPYHDARYGAFSRLVVSTFDEAAGHFDDESIDLLHVDGYHTYEAVQHDYSTWKAKLSRRGVILFHDTTIRERGFGVWRLWQELCRDHAHFEFLHGSGLGVLVVGEEAPDAVLRLARLPETRADSVRKFYWALAQSLVLSHRLRAFTAEKTAELALVRAELATVKDSVFWRCREFLARLPGLSAVARRMAERKRAR